MRLVPALTDDTPSFRLQYHRRNLVGGETAGFHLSQGQGRNTGLGPLATQAFSVYGSCERRNEHHGGYAPLLWK